MRPLLVLLAAAALLAGCGADDPDADRPGGTLTVYAAASLIDVFERVEAAYRERHPDVDVDIGYLSSAGAATAISQGAPIDVFASADERQMQVVADAGLAEDPQVFAENVLTLAVPEGNPAGVTGLADLAREDLAVALCAPDAPCGAAAERLLAAAGVTARPDTYEEDARATLQKVELGEVDAALVYVTDAAARQQTVDAIEVPEAAAAANRYPISVLAGARDPAAAQAFVDLVLSAEGRELLRDAGFRTP
ncbi:molybdate ABC transporter substrate-binding protein [Blastococcus sp. MG754426]|uniref:molybdate ABC transporter substrate-binding protein n=1 Tax=unclassified Blastococcus TaxID=2619396 RepID=UPI001EF1135B|nr:MULTISPECIES: molybdate ABC transporter substrate-binding protein [unclassified Blastococcus]MCF6506773.1 molybdate ABC transporter substrate-binding protein [Blastococcus sp. MG754426]MCF6511344.1 molybdate ABC transporter substrate-binding protein [Blastococcus sp. MG754427]